MKKLVKALIIATLTFSSLCNAEPNKYGWDLYGYADQAIVSANGISLGGSSNGKLSFNKNEIVVFADKRFEWFDFRSSVGTQDEPRLDKGQIGIRYMLADFQSKINDSSLYGLRVGKVPLRLGFYNSWRNNPHYGEYIYLPEGMYKEQFKWLTMSGWGGQVYYSKELGNSTSLTLEAALVKSNLDPNYAIVNGWFNFPDLGTFDNGSILNINADLSIKNFKFQYDYNQLKFDFSAIPPWKNNGIVFDRRLSSGVHTLSVRWYVTPTFDTTAEYIRVFDSEPVMFGYPVGYMLGAKYSVTPRLKVSFNHSEWYNANDDKNGERTAALFWWTYLPAHSAYVKSNTLALNYEINKNWAVRVQHSLGKGISSYISSANDYVKDSPKWQYTALQTVYSF